MKIKDVLKFEKENMPDFQWRYEKFLFVFLVIWLGGAILTLIVSFIIGLTSGESGGLWYIPIIIWGSALAVTLIVFVIKTKSVKSKLKSYHIEKLLSEFCIIEYSEAKQNLLDNKRITEEGFIIDSDNPFEDIVIPFEQVQIIFNPRFWGGKLFLEIIVKDESNWLIIDNLDNFYFNFLIKRIDLIQNKNLFKLFCDDKEQFVNMLLRYNNASKIEKKLC